MKKNDSKGQKILNYTQTFYFLLLQSAIDYYAQLFDGKSLGPKKLKIGSIVVTADSENQHFSAVKITGKTKIAKVYDVFTTDHEGLYIKIYKGQER